MIFKELLQDDAVLSLILFSGDWFQRVEDVEGPEVEFVHPKDDGIAADDEGEVPEVLHSLGQTNGQLPLQVLGTLLKTTKQRGN